MAREIAVFSRNRRRTSWWSRCFPRCYMAARINWPRLLITGARQGWEGSSKPAKEFIVGRLKCSP